MNAVDQSRQMAHSRGPRDYDFWNSHGGVSLVWSNRHASDHIMILNALLKPSFHLLLDIASHFGFRRLEETWNDLRRDILATGWPEERVDLARAEPVVDRCLAHMRAGMEISQGAKRLEANGATVPVTKQALVAQKRETIQRLAQLHGASDVRLFGSAARGDEAPGSDIDFLVKMQPGRSLLDRAQLVVELEHLLGCKVDVVNEAGVKPRFLAKVQPDLIAL